MDKAERNRLRRERKRVMQAYFDDLPRVAMSRCPFSGTIFAHSFDPWGTDGFWWQERALKKTSEPEPSLHFQQLQGALSLNDQPPLGGEIYQAHVGPEVPFMVPRLLAIPNMIAVISSIHMHNGYIAYPICYYSKHPLPRPGMMGMPWRRTSYDFVTASGRPGFCYPNDPWDFDLQPWIDKGRVQWIYPNDDSLTLQTHGPCPYVNLPSHGQSQIIIGNTCRLQSPPRGQTIDPFNE